MAIDKAFFTRYHTILPIASFSSTLAVWMVVGMVDVDVEDFECLMFIVRHTSIQNTITFAFIREWILLDRKHANGGAKQTPEHSSCGVCWNTFGDTKWIAFGTKV